MPMFWLAQFRDVDNALLRLDDYFGISTITLKRSKTPIVLGLDDGSGEVSAMAIEGLRS